MSETEANRPKAVCINQAGFAGIRNGHRYEVVASPGGLCKGGIVIVNEAGEQALYPDNRFYLISQTLD